MAILACPNTTHTFFLLYGPETQMPEKHGWLIKQPNMLIHYQHTLGVHRDKLYMCVRVSDSGGWAYLMGFGAALGTPLGRKGLWQCERDVCSYFVLLPTQQKSAVQETCNTTVLKSLIYSHSCCCKSV